MSDEPPTYTGHDFAELMSATVAEAESITLMLRSRGVDARAMAAGGWTISGPSDVAVVLVPRKDLAEARAHLERSTSEPPVVDADADARSAIEKCPTCGYPLDGLAAAKLCPECGGEIDPPGSPPAALKDLRAKRERYRPVALGLIALIFVIAVFLSITRGFRHVWW